MQHNGIVSSHPFLSVSSLDTHQIYPTLSSSEHPTMSVPSDAPPAYDEVVGSSASRPNANSSSNGGNHLQVPGTGKHGGIPAEHRRSMEDEHRPLPKGWVRSFDPENSHQFFVDTTQDPPRSTWVHPYDDEQYLSTLSSKERERVEQESMGRGHPPSKTDILSADTDDEDDQHQGASSSSHQNNQELPPRPDGKGKGKLSFGRKLKDKMTGMSHEDREKERQRRAEEEQALYERHLRIREAMATAQRTGKPQFIGKGKDGKDLYVEPAGYGDGFGYNPYGNGATHVQGNARYIRPAAPYSRPYGMGYGGGYGLPLAMGGGLMGGMLLGDMAMGGMGGMGMGGMGGGFGGGGL